ncbi:RNA polymerase sigma factor [Chitinophaga niabensis]|uniref:RNA polymerase sigma-70 factor, ECF subfamily n=1 Tax=Chitinophaga niabensis TaxID=536979 RepID=A0A1N6D476_9BACT|nr:sigma-70 family RNA polymerase sigma factor [Chitinophaga niabensis]SIN65618.1 RNA polymerase sigma-70 factor, ECF subfamily [Chitinophaga niabensis]
MQNIVLAIGNGDKHSFKEFFEDYFPILCAFSFKYIKDEEQCKDIAQEALLTYWEKRADFDSIYKVKSFVYMVARNRCLNIIKRMQVGASYLQEAKNELEFFFEENIIEQETFLMVRKAIEALPPQMRTVISYSMEGLKKPQIAAEMGIAEGTVHSLKKTAYKKLREQLQGHFYLLLLY